MEMESLALACGLFFGCFLLSFIHCLIYFLLYYILFFPPNRPLNLTETPKGTTYLDLDRRIIFKIVDCKTNTQIAKELKITPILDKLLEYKRNWIQYVNRIPRKRLPRIMKHYSPTGRRNHGRALKRLLYM